MARRRGNRTESVAIVRAKLDNLEPINGKKPFAVVAVDSNQSLSHLAATILLNFGFEMDHCYGFYNDTRYYTRSTEKYELFADIGEAEGPGVQHVPIKQVFSPGRRMLLLFDYIGQWHFIVSLERYDDAVPGQEYPTILRSHAIPLDNYYVRGWPDDDDEDDDDYYDGYDARFFDPLDEDWEDDLSFAPGGAKSDRASLRARFVPPSGTELPYVPPTLRQWGELFDAAIEFRDSHCFEWVDDTQLFGVTEPSSGSVWYCLILGNSGGVRGLAAYEGPMGLASLLETMEPDARPENAIGPNAPRSLLMFLGNRDKLDSEDSRVLKGLGLRFRGANQWPQFRSLVPGYRPWYLAGDEAVTMTLILRQSLEVARKLREQPDLPLVKGDWSILTRVPVGKNAARFKNAYVKPDTEVVVPGFFDVPIDELKIRRLKRDMVRSKSTWEVSAKWVEEPMRQNQRSRPFYPIMLVWVDRSTGIVLSARLTSFRGLADELVNSTLACIEQHAMIPKEIEVDSADSMVILDKLSRLLGVQLRQVDKLRKSDIVRDELYEYLRRHKQS